MKNTLILTENQTHFLQENRQDPITGDGFSLGDEIVFCAECKSAFLKESWEYMDGRHCSQYKILSDFPVPKEFLLKKSVKKVWIDEKMQTRLAAFSIDITIAFSIMILLVIFLISFDFNPEYSFIIGSITLIFRDTLLLNQSIGKRRNNIYFIDNRTKEDAVFYKVFMRNLIWWLFNALIAYIFSPVAIPLIITFNLFHVLYMVYHGHSFLDKLLQIRLVSEEEIREITDDFF